MLSIDVRDLVNLNKLFKYHFVEYKMKDDRLCMFYTLEIKKADTDDLVYRAVYDADSKLSEKHTSELLTSTEIKVLDKCFVPSEVVKEIQSDLFQLTLDMSESKFTMSDLCLERVSDKKLEVFHTDIDEIYCKADDLDLVFSI